MHQDPHDPLGETPGFFCHQIYTAKSPHSLRDIFFSQCCTYIFKSLFTWWLVQTHHETRSSENINSSDWKINHRSSPQKLTCTFGSEETTNTAARRGSLSASALAGTFCPTKPTVRRKEDAAHWAGLYILAEKHPSGLKCRIHHIVCGQSITVPEKLQVASLALALTRSKKVSSRSNFMVSIFFLC